MKILPFKKPENADEFRSEKLQAFSEKRRLERERRNSNNRILRRMIKGFRNFREWHRPSIRSSRLEYVDVHKYIVEKRSTLLQSYYTVSIIWRNSLTPELLFDTIQQESEAKQLAEDHAREHRYTQK